MSRHGKGLVDTMSGFGVKGSIRRAVVTKNFSFTSAENIYNYLYNLFEIDEQKEHYLVTPETIHSKRSNDKLKIDGCIPLHMFCYSPDGSILLKRRICSCCMCKVGKFIECNDEKGVITMQERVTKMNRAALQVIAKILIEMMRWKKLILSNTK